MDAALFSAHDVNTPRAAIEGSTTLEDGSEVVWGLSRKEFGPMTFKGHPEWDVAHNRMQFLKLLDLDIETTVSPGLLHTANVYVVGPDDVRKGARELKSAPQPVDALVTKEPGITLLTTHADCLPVWMIAPHSGWIGVAHAGWRGIVAGIVPAMINSIPKEDRTDLAIAIGPGISAKHYEVGKEVAERFLENDITANAVLQENGSFHIDLARAVQNQAESLGVNVNTDMVACTYEKPYLSSYRRDGSRFAPMAAVISRLTNG